MSFDPERIIAALESLPRDKRPYSIRDMCVRDVGLRDLLNDLRPFIEAESSVAPEPSESMRTLMTLEHATDPETAIRHAIDRIRGDYV